MAAEEKDTPKKKIDGKLMLIILVALLFIVMPLAISIWDVNTPIKGYHN